MPPPPEHFPIARDGGGENFWRNGDSERDRVPVQCEIHGHRSSGKRRWSGADVGASDRSGSRAGAMPRSYENQGGIQQGQPSCVCGAGAWQEGLSSSDGVDAWSGGDDDLGYQIRAQEDERYMTPTQDAQASSSDIPRAEVEGVASGGGQEAGRRTGPDHQTLKCVEEHYGAGAIVAGDVEQDPGGLVCRVFVPATIRES